MKLGLTDFRGFHSLPPVTIKPLTLLVGENSAGKSSFLAAMRIAMQLLGERSLASFNRNPFFLGAYEQIAHYRRGKRSLASCFTLEACLTVKPDSRYLIGARNIDRARDRTPVEVTVKFTFANEKSQPILQHFELSFPEYSLRLNLRAPFRLQISTPSLTDYELPEELSTQLAARPVLEYNTVMYLARDLQYLMRHRSLNLPAAAMPEIERFGSVIEGIRSAVKGEIYASAPVRTEPVRTYNPEEAVSSPEGRHIPFVLAQMETYEPALWVDMRERLQAFGRQAGLFEEIDIRRFGTPGSGAGPFQIVINTINGVAANMMDVGYGVSQALPLIVELIRVKKGTFLFQQPEVHLHPSAQAELATFFASIVNERKHTVVVETHSDYILDRIRMDIRDKKSLREQDVSILYFERRGADIKIHELCYDALGNVVGAPASYRRFFLQEEFRSVGLKD